MNQAPVREWYLEIHGIKTGPYTPDQVQGLLEEGEILVTTAVFHVSQAHLPTDQIEWFTAGEFVNGFRDYVSTANLATHATKTSLPVEPTEPKVFAEPGASDSQAPSQAPSQAIDDLFETLLLARDRKKQTKMTPPNPEEWGTLSRDRLPASPTIAFAAALALVFLIAIWGMVKLFNHKPSSETPSSNASTPATPNPPTPPTPPANPPVKSSNTTPAPREEKKPSPPQPVRERPQAPAAPVQPAPLQPEAIREERNPETHPPVADGEPVPTDGQAASPTPETAHFEEGGRLEGAGPIPENSPVSETPPSEVAPQHLQ